MGSIWKWRTSDIRLVTIVLLGCVAASVACLLLSYGFMERVNRPFLRKVQQVRPGMAKERAMVVLGREAFTLRPNPDGTDPYVAGYMPPKRKITHEAIACYGGFDLLVWFMFSSGRTGRSKKP